jgi:hypothetical protein
MSKRAALPVAALGFSAMGDAPVGDAPLPADRFAIPADALRH